jgi:hypothetical protein
MIPNRQKIQEKLKQIKEDVTIVNKETAFIDWLDSLGMPETITIANEERDPKQDILSDLDSYGSI